jgi:FlaG/FlaF family flagellin (archaellin)
MTRIIEKDLAVSAVVGVMLMLVVTVIIASVISAYAGGLAPNQDQAPQVSVVARVNETDPSYIYFDHMGGDGFSIDDLTIILDYQDDVLKIMNRTINTDYCKLENKAGTAYIQPGDTIMLKGKNNGTVTDFTLDGGSSISIGRQKEFTWTLLWQRGNTILARGTLVFPKP